MAGTTVHTLENQQLLEQVERESAAAARQLAETAHLRKGQLVVIGCSTSEVVGHQVGSWSTPEVADAIFRGLDSVFGPHGRLHGRPMLRASEPGFDRGIRGGPRRGDRQCGAPAQGGQFLRYRRLQGVSGILWRWRRSGQTQDWTSAAPLIGMHLKKVAVPVRLEQDHIGQAIVLAARVRPKFIGGDRAVYDETLKEGYPDFTD